MPAGLHVDGGDVVPRLAVVRLQLRRPRERLSSRPALQFLEEQKAGQVMMPTQPRLLGATKRQLPTRNGVVC